MKKGFNYKKIFGTILVSFFVASTFCLIGAIQNKPIQNADAYVQQINQYAQSIDISNLAYSYDGQVKTVYNFLVPIRFDGETDIMQTTNTRYNKSNYDVLQDIFNSEDTYSVKKYYQVVSNGLVNLETVIILDNNSAFEVSQTRSQLCNKNRNNGVGYDPNNLIYGVTTGYITLYQMFGEICDFALDEISQDYQYSCDSNNDNIIDSMSIYLMPDQANPKHVVEWGDLLWPHSSEFQTTVVDAFSSNGVDINDFRFTNSSGKTIYAGTYMLTDYDDTPNAVSGTPIDTTAVHELGHVLGFPDYYVYDTSFANTVKDNETASVFFWDIMGYNHMDLPQYPLTYNRYKMGWVDENNIEQIIHDGQYSILPVNYEEVNNIALGNRTLAYKIQSKKYPDQAVYLEYRQQVDGSFENNKSYGLQDGLLVYRVDDGFLQASGFDQMTSPGNFAATPYNVYVFRNQTTNSYFSSQTYTDNAYAPLNLTNNIMGDGTAFIKDGVTYTPCDITWQVYETGKRQESYTTSDVTEEDSGIVVRVVNIDSVTGLLTFEIEGVEKPIEKNVFGDGELYNQLLLAVGKNTQEKLYPSDTQNLTSLDLFDKGITSVEGLQLMNLNKLKTLDLSLNKLSNYTEITNLLSVYPNLKINLAFNKFSTSSIPENLKTNNIIIGFQNIENNICLFYNQTETIDYAVSFYANNYTDVIFNNIAVSQNNKHNLSLGKNTLTINFLTNEFKNKISFDIYVVRVYLSSNNVNIERNSAMPHIVIEGADDSVLQVTQTPSNIDTTIVTSSMFNVTWNIVFKQDTLQSKNISHTYQIVDTLAPQITLNGSNKFEITKGDTIILPSPEIYITDNNQSVNYNFIQNPTATDINYWTKNVYDITNGQKTLISQLTSANYGLFLISYTACDQSGNKYTLEERYVEIVPISISKDRFADENLYNAILEMTGKLKVYENSLGEFDLIDFSNRNITSVQGLQYLQFKNNVVINFSSNQLEKESEITTLLSNKPNIKVIILHLNKFYNYNMYANLASNSKVSLGLQGINFGKYIKNGNTGENISFTFYGTDAHFTIDNNFIVPEIGYNFIEDFGKYNFKLDYNYSINSLQGCIEFGAINFEYAKQVLEVYGNYSTNVIYDYFEEDTFEISYKLNNQPILFENIQLNQTLGEKVLEVTYSYQGNKLITISKTFVVQDTTKPTISFEDNKTIYLKTGQEPSISLIVDDNYTSQDGLQITEETDFVKDVCGIYTFSYYVKDTSGNISQTITKTVYVGNVSTKPDVVFEYMQTVNMTDLFNFTIYEPVDFYVQIVSGVNTNVLSSQSINYILTLKKSNLEFDLELTVDVEDNTAPNITLIGNERVELYLKSVYSDAGYTALDNYDGDISNRVVKTGQVNTNLPGVYFINYTVTDTNGNTSNPIVRTVVVKYKPVNSLEVTIENKLNVYSKNVKIEFSLVLDEQSSKYYNSNLNLSWYVDGKCVQTGPAKKLIYSFDESGSHNVKVGVENELLYGETDIVYSKDYNIVIQDDSFLQKYGMYLIGFGSGGIVITVICLFIIRKKRNNFYWYNLNRW